MSNDRRSGSWSRRRLGLLAVASSVVYFVSDVLEVGQGGFTRTQLALTLVAEATLPVFVLGLARAQRAHLSRIGLFAAIAYAGAYVYFTYTVIYALAYGVANFETLDRDLAPVMTLAGAVMVLAGVTFGFATYRAQVLPRWTGPTLAIGVLLVAATVTLPSAMQLLATGVRDLAFLGMGASVAWVRADRDTPVGDTHVVTGPADRGPHRRTGDGDASREQLHPRRDVPLLTSADTTPAVTR